MKDRKLRPILVKRNTEQPVAIVQPMQPVFTKSYDQMTTGEKSHYTRVHGKVLPAKGRQPAVIQERIGLIIEDGGDSLCISSNVSNWRIWAECSDDNKSLTGLDQVFGYLDGDTRSDDLTALASQVSAIQQIVTAAIERTNDNSLAALIFAISSHNAVGSIKCIAVDLSEIEIRGGQSLRKLYQLEDDFLARQSRADAAD